MLILLVIFSVPAFAAPEGIGYVTDELYLTLFKDKDGSGGKIKSLESGDMLDILEDAGAYSRVRAPTGEEGWVKSNYIVAEPPGKAKAVELERTIASRDEKIKKLEQILDSKKIGESLRADYEKQLVKANQENVQLFNDKQQLRKKLDQASLEVRHLESDLEERQRLHPLLIPAVSALIALLIGIVIGWSLHVRKLKKRFYGFKM